MDWLKNNWKTIAWILVAVSVLILLYVIFWPSKVPTSHDREKKTIDSLILVINNLKTTSHETIYKDSTIIANSKKKADSLSAQKEIWQARAKVNEANEKYWALKYRESRTDTGQAFAACDQLIQIVDSQSMVINTLNAIGDSIEVQHFIQLNTKDSIILTQTVLLKATEDGLVKQNKAYNGLFSDFLKEVKTNKSQRFWLRVLAASTLILAGTTYLLAK